MRKLKTHREKPAGGAAPACVPPRIDAKPTPAPKAQKACTCGGGCPKCTAQVVAPDHPSEREADAVAEKVISAQGPAPAVRSSLGASSLSQQPMEDEKGQLMPKAEGAALLRQPMEEEEEELMPKAESGAAVLNRQPMEEEEEEELMQPKAEPGDAPLSRQASDEEEEEEEFVQPKAEDAGGARAALADPLSGLGAGKPMGPDLRAYFEPRFGRDFGKVRIHDDAAAHDRAKRLGAQAFAYGRRVVFGPGRFQPGTQEGRRLIAHELTHVAQQGRADAKAVQRSPLSDELEELWLDGYEEDVFDRLRDMDVCDTDVSRFIETMMSDEDQARARFAMGQTRLNPTQRGALFTFLSGRMTQAHVNFQQACNNVREDLRAEAEARAAIATLMLNVAFAFIVPGLGSSITRLVNHIPASASVGVHRAALAIQSQASNIASAIGEVGKQEGARIIRENYAGNNPRDFFENLVEAYEAGQDEIRGYVSSHITDTDTLPDEQLWLYVANWDPREYSATTYAGPLRRVWERYQRQVLAIGTMDTRIYGGGGAVSSETTVRRLAYIRTGGRTRLARVDVAMGTAHVLGPRRSFVSWIDADMEEAARARHAGHGDIQTYDADDVYFVPR